MITTRITVDSKEVGAYDQRTIEQRVSKNEQALQAQADIPTTLPNPNALTFTGAVTGSYDGSAPLKVEIPTVDDVLAALPAWEGGSY